MGRVGLENITFRVQVSNANLHVDCTEDVGRTVVALGEHKLVVHMHGLPDYRQVVEGIAYTLDPFELDCAYDQLKCKIPVDVWNVGSHWVL